MIRTSGLLTVVVHVSAKKKKMLQYEEPFLSGDTHLSSSIPPLQQTEKMSAISLLHNATTARHLTSGIGKYASYPKTLVAAHGTIEVLRYTTYWLNFFLIEAPEPISKNRRNVMLVLQYKAYIFSSTQAMFLFYFIELAFVPYNRRACRDPESAHPRKSNSVGHLYRCLRLASSVLRNSVSHSGKQVFGLNGINASPTQLGPQNETRHLKLSIPLSDARTRGVDPWMLTSNI